MKDRPRSTRPRPDDPLADQRESERLERLLTSEPRLKKASALTFDADAAREAAERVGGDLQSLERLKADSVA